MRVPVPGYCFSWVGHEKDCPRTQEWDTDVLLESDIDYYMPQFRGMRTIDGSLCAIWYAGEVRGMQRYIAQVAIPTCQAVA